MPGTETGGREHPVLLWLEGAGGHHGCMGVAAASLGLETQHLGQTLVASPPVRGSMI